MITHIVSGKCMEAGVHPDNMDLHLSQCDGKTRQLWRFDQVHPVDERWVTVAESKANNEHHITAPMCPGPVPCTQASGVGQKKLPLKKKKQKTQEISPCSLCYWLLAVIWKEAMELSSSPEMIITKQRSIFSFPTKHLTFALSLIVEKSTGIAWQ